MRRAVVTETGPTSEVSSRTGGPAASHLAEPGVLIAIKRPQPTVDGAPRA